MKSIYSVFTPLLLLLLIAMGTTPAAAQQTRDLQNFRAPDRSGLNTFEAPKETDSTFDGLRVRIGGSNTLQFQGLDHSNSGSPLQEIGPDFNLATSNLDLDVQLHNGLRMHLRTYLSSRHHAEAWVKGGYLQVDRLDFIAEDFLSELMDRVTIKVGHMEINYGDAHFRRSDNGQAIYNPFVGNYIMDSFTTEVGGEVYYRDSGFRAMVGLTNGKLKHTAVRCTEPATRPSIVGKLGYDRQIDEDLRVRVTGSLYTTSQSAAINLYGGDRAGARYYNVMTTSPDDFRTGRFNPGFSTPADGGKMTAIMINPFVKYRGLEFFGLYENATGRSGAETDNRTFHQLGAELLYRFGGNEDLYIGGRYNLVTGEQAGTGRDIDITRYNIGGGWFMTNNILAKLEYVRQSYDGFAPATTFHDGRFHGIMLEAVVSF